jgi:flagellar motor switch protein FliG
MTEEQATMSGIRKIAVLFVALGEETSAKLMSTFDRDTVEEISREIANLEEITPEDRNAVVEEFYNLALARSYVEQGGLQYAKSLLKKSMEPETADEILKVVQQSISHSPFHFLQRTESENLLTFIQEEHPQTIALIISHLAPERAADVLAGLPQKKQIEVVKRVANMEQTNPEVIKDVERGLESRLSSLVNQKLEKAGGVETVAEILNLSDRSTEKGILESLEEDDPDLVEQIRRLMFVFEDILLVNDKGIQTVLKEIDNDELALALKTASPELKDKIFKNMSDRASQLIKEDMEYMGPVRLADVEQAQQRIVDVVRRLEDAGEIIIQGRGGESEVVV